MKNNFLRILISLGLVGLLLAAASPALAQASEYRLNVQRVFGFSSGSQIRGTFVAEVIGPDNILSATFLIDGQTMAEITQKPFRLQFKTIGLRHWLARPERQPEDHWRRHSFHPGAPL